VIGYGGVDFRKNMRMQSLDSLSKDAADALAGRKLIDKCGEAVGTVEGFWLDPSSHRIAYFGVKSGWLPGNVHIVPAADAEIDENGCLMAVRHSAAFIRKAPSGLPAAELAEVAKEEINAYYGRFMPLSRVSSIRQIRPEETLESSPKDTASGGEGGPAKDRSRLESTEQLFFDQKGFITDSMSEVDASGDLAQTQEEARIRHREDRKKRGDLD
jgi:hypothetical protein